MKRHILTTRVQVRRDFGGNAVAELSKKQQRRARDEQIARRLGVSVETLLEARNTVSSADQGLLHLPKPSRAAAASRRLGITVTELKMLRRGLGEPNAPDLDRVRSLLRGGLSPATKERPHSSGPAQRYQQLGGRLSPPTGVNRKAQPDAYTILFVTSWGNVVHLYYDCHGTRGFRHVGEPDNAVYKVEARDPCCRGRRVCRVCEPEQGIGWVALLTRLLVGLHGRMLEDDEWEQHSRNRPLPQGPPYRGIARKTRDSPRPVQSHDIRSRSKSQPKTLNGFGSDYSGTFSPMKEQKYAVGDTVTWKGYDGVIVEITTDRLLRALDGGARIGVPRQEFAGKT